METYSKSDDGGIVWLNINKVIGYDGHLMVVNAEILDRSSSRIDQAHLIGLATLDAELGIL